MLVMIAVAAKLHIHFGAPRQPQAGTGGPEADWAVLNRKMIPCEREGSDGLAQVRFYAQEIVVGGSNPEAALDGNGVDFAVAAPVADRVLRVLLFFEADLPGGAPAD